MADEPMIPRALLPIIEKGLGRDGCALLIGPHEVGKSELAREIVRRSGDGAHYFNGRNERDRAELAGDAGLVRNSAGKIIVIDEIHGFPDCLDLIRTEIESARDHGQPIGCFLILGGASLEAAQLVATKLGTRAPTYRLSPIDVLELPGQGPLSVGNARTVAPNELEIASSIPKQNDRIPMETLWLRGGFPKSLRADRDDDSFSWRQEYIDKLCHRGYGHLHPSLSPSSVLDFLKRIATLHGATITPDKLVPEQRPCLGHFEDLGLVRRLPPWYPNELKRLEKAPRVYIRDSGLLHCLRQIRTHGELRANDVAYGQSWEGFCIENLTAVAGTRAQAFFYRPRENEELDLILEFAGGRRWAIEFKGGYGNPTGGFFKAADAIGAEKRIVIKPVPESYDVTSYAVKTLPDAMNMVRQLPR